MDSESNSDLYCVEENSSHSTHVSEHRAGYVALDADCKLPAGVKALVICNSQLYMCSDAESAGHSRDRNSDGDTFYLPILKYGTKGSRRRSKELIDGHTPRGNDAGPTSNARKAAQNRDTKTPTVTSATAPRCNKLIDDSHISFPDAVTIIYADSYTVLSEEIAIRPCKPQVTHTDRSTKRDIESNTSGVGSQSPISSRRKFEVTTNLTRNETKSRLITRYTNTSRHRESNRIFVVNENEKAPTNKQLFQNDDTKEPTHVNDEGGGVEKKEKRNEKSTYCRPLIKPGSPESYIKKVNKLQAVVKEIAKARAKAREEEKQNEAWSKYFKELRSKCMKVEDCEVVPGPSTSIGAYSYEQMQPESTQSADDYHYYKSRAINSQSDRSRALSEEIYGHASMRTIQPRCCYEHIQVTDEKINTDTITIDGQIIPIVPRSNLLQEEEASCHPMYLLNRPPKTPCYNSIYTEVLPDQVADFERYVSPEKIVRHKSTVFPTSSVQILQNELPKTSTLSRDAAVNTNAMELNFFNDSKLNLQKCGIDSKGLYLLAIKEPYDYDNTFDADTFNHTYLYSCKPHSNEPKLAKNIPVPEGKSHELTKSGSTSVKKHCDVNVNTDTIANNYLHDALKPNDFGVKISQQPVSILKKNLCDSCFNTDVTVANHHMDHGFYHNTVSRSPTKPNFASATTCYRFSDEKLYAECKISPNEERRTHSNTLTKKQSKDEESIAQVVVERKQSANEQCSETKKKISLCAIAKRCLMTKKSKTKQFTNEQCDEANKESFKEKKESESKGERSSDNMLQSKLCDANPKTNKSTNEQADQVSDQGKSFKENKGPKEEYEKVAENVARLRSRNESCSNSSSLQNLEMKLDRLISTIESLVGELKSTHNEPPSNHMKDFISKHPHVANSEKSYYTKGEYSDDPDGKKPKRRFSVSFWDNKRGLNRPVNPNTAHADHAAKLFVDSANSDPTVMGNRNFQIVRDPGRLVAKQLSYENENIPTKSNYLNTKMNQAVQKTDFYGAAAQTSNLIITPNEVSKKVFYSILTKENPRIEQILKEEMGKSVQAKKDIEDIINGEFRSQALQIEVEIPTRERSTEVTASLSATKVVPIPAQTSKNKILSSSISVDGTIQCSLSNRNKREHTFTSEGGDASNERKRFMTVKLETIPLGLLGALRMSTQTICRIVAFMQSHYSGLQSLLPIPIGSPSQYVGSIYRAVFGNPSDYEEHVQNQQGDAPPSIHCGCCVCRHLLALRSARGRPGLFRCRFCGQVFTRAYCCELHQQTCARRLKRATSISESLTLLK